MTQVDRQRAAGALILLGLLGGLSAEAQDGPHAYGKLIPHINPELEFTLSGSYEGRSNLRDCRDAICDGVVNSDEPQIWFVLASFDESPGPVELGGLRFGFTDFDPSKILISEWGACNDGFLELSSAGWPGPDEGTCFSFKPPHLPTGRLVELYWFVSYVYAPESITFGPDGDHGAQFAGSHDIGGPPPVLDEIYDFGAIGFGEAGYNPCSTSLQPGACCVVDICYLVTRDECEAMGGFFQGTNTECFPNPCTNIIPFETNWSNIKRLFR